MYKKFVASFMSALMAAMMLVSPAMGATALNTYPTFLGLVGDFYVVVGADAAASDVAGAIDVAANLAQLSYTETSITGTTSTGLTGIERKIVIPTSSTTGVIAGATANNLPTTLKNFHYSGLKEGQFEYKGTKYNYHEEVRGSTTDPKFKLTHTISTPVNGTLKMRIDNSGIEYRYVFDSTISTSNFGPATTANATTYQDPILANVAGREFRIVAIPSSTSFIALVGTVGWVTQGSTTGVTAGDLTALTDTIYSGTQAAIRIVDADGNTVQNLGVVGSTTKSFTYGGSTYNIKVLQTATVTVSGAGDNQAQLLFGKGDIEKTFDGSDTATVTDFGSNWKISGSFSGTTGTITKDDYIKVDYSPASLTDDTRYYVAGSVFKGPNDYFEVKYVGYEPSKFTQVTIAPVTGVTVYNTTATTGYSTTTDGGGSGLNGLKISSDVAGSVVNGSTGYDEMYVLFNGSGSATQWLGEGSVYGAYYWLAYKDKSTGRVVNADQTGSASQWPTALPTNTSAANTSAVNLTLQYGGPGAQATYILNITFNNQTLIDEVQVWSSLTAQEISMNFQNRSIASTSTPELRLGVTTGKADTNDVTARIEGTVAQDVSAQVGSLISDNGVQVYTVSSNVEGDKVVLGINPETVYGLIQFGKIGEAAVTTGGTVKEVVAITTAVAKLDSEVTSTIKSGKHLVLVGGPCKNTLVADLNTAGKFDYGCTDWPGENFALIKVVDNAFATGKYAVVVAGTRADDTRLASSVLQSYATKLTGITNATAKVSGTALATATIAAQ